jgi:hypothetical protein
MALITLGNILQDTDPSASREATLSARRLAAEIGERWWASTAAVVLAQYAVMQGNWDEAAAELEASRAATGEAGPGWIHTVNTLSAEVEWQRGNAEAARRHLARGLTDMRRNPLLAAYAELTLASELAAHDAALEPAAVLLSAARSLYAELGFREDDFDLARAAHIETLVREPLGEAGWEASCARGRSLSLDDALELACSTIGTNVSTPEGEER